MKDLCIINDLHHRYITMSVYLLDNGTVDFKKCDILEHRLLLGLDCGSSLTKIIFLHKSNEHQLLDKEIDFVTFNHGSFKHEDFENVLRWVKESVYIPKETSYVIKITGKYSVLRKYIIESILELKAEYIDEMLTVIAGHRMAFKKIGLKHLIQKPVEIDNLGMINSKFLDILTEGMSSNLLKCSNDSENVSSFPFPCLVNVYGSDSSIYLFDNEGRGESLSLAMSGGSSFLGLAKCLLDTNDYDQVMKLALHGNRRNVDTQVKEIIMGAINSPYGNFPPDIPVFSFGKSMDFNKGLEDFDKEDVAQSLVAFFSLNILMQSIQVCQFTKINKIYLTGNMFRSNLFQKEIKQAMLIFPLPFDIKILDFGYFGALGAMLCNNDDKNIYYPK